MVVPWRWHTKCSPKKALPRNIAGVSFILSVRVMWFQQLTDGGCFPLSPQLFSLQSRHELSVDFPTGLQLFPLPYWGFATVPFPSDQRFQHHQAAGYQLTSSTHVQRAVIGPRMVLDKTYPNIKRKVHFRLLASREQA